MMRIFKNPVDKKSGKVTEKDEVLFLSKLNIMGRPVNMYEEVCITANVESMSGNDLICIIEARSGDRMIAMGKTDQKMLKKDNLNKLFGHGRR